MTDCVVRELPDQSDRRDGAVSDLYTAKLRRPMLRAGTVPRLSLIGRLEESKAPLVSVVAPAGYGKTTLLSQWAERNGRGLAWVSVEEQDNDPKVLLTYIAEALNAVQQLDRRVFAALASPVSSVPGSVVPRLGSAFSAMTRPVLLVLDDVHVLRNPECRAALSVLADHVPPGSRLVLAGRAEPPLRMARLRAEGRIAAIGSGDLSLTLSETESLLNGAGLNLGEDEVAALHRRTEGWPAGLYLAALCLKEGGPLATAAVAFRGDDQMVSEYIESEFLTRISGRQRTFLTRTAVLGRMSGPLSEAVADLYGAPAILAELAQSNLLLVSLDRRGEWYRYHHLFRDMLLADLRRREPDLIPVLQRRAAAWSLANGLPEEALEYSMAAGDVDSAADLVRTLALPSYWAGRMTTIQRWYGWLESREALQRYPILAVYGAMLSALTGRPATAERWADMVDRWQDEDALQTDDPAAQAWAAQLRAILCRRGVKQMLADADEAVRRFTAGNIKAPGAALTYGIACTLSGDLEGGDTSFQSAVSIATEAGAYDTLAEALCQRSLIAITRGAWSQAASLAEEAESALRKGGGESYPTPLVCAVQARIAMHRGDVPAARRELVGAQRTRPVLTYALPHLAVQARLELSRVRLALSDTAGARTLMHEVDDLLRRRPDLGTLADEARALRARLLKEGGSIEVGASALTTAELRLLPMLSTHLSMPQIAAEMFLSRHTIRSQAMSVYRKLGVSSRSEAIARARELGLLDG